MSHNLTERDQQIGLKQAWHGLTTVVDAINVKDNYLTQWDVERKPLTYINNNDEEVGPGPAPSPCKILSPTGFPSKITAFITPPTLPM